MLPSKKSTCVIDALPAALADAVSSTVAGVEYVVLFAGDVTLTVGGASTVISVDRLTVARAAQALRA